MSVSRGSRGGRTEWAEPESAGQLQDDREVERQLVLAAAFIAGSGFVKKRMDRDAGDVDQIGGHAPGGHVHFGFFRGNKERFAEVVEPGM